MCFYRGKGFIADNVFNTAGILGCGLLVYSQSHQHIGKYGVTLVKLFCKFFALGGHCNVAFTIHRDMLTIP